MCDTSVATDDSPLLFSTVLSSPPSLVSISRADDPMEVVPTIGEAIITGPEDAPLEIPQIHDADPHDNTFEMPSGNPSDTADDPYGPLENDSPVAKTKTYDMVENVKLLLPIIATILEKMDQMYQGMPSTDDLTHGLYDIQAEIDEFNLYQVESIASIEHKLEDLVSRRPLLAVNVDDDKEGEKSNEDLGENIAMENSAGEDTRENIPEAISDDDALVIVAAAANHEDLHPSTSAFPNVGDEDDDDDDEDSEPQLPDAGTDLGGNDNDDDEDDDDDDDFCVQIIPRQPTKGISFRNLLPRGRNHQGTNTTQAKEKEWLKTTLH
ncbi:coiled-coil domain-containing protein 1-like [Cynara cardunculus var. scolymus]|uniref:coiled-coil domain-containing protein 1-like n=1 Tax=Cynara cardunculus var. scolymus TaxID=59895 RepID=UPI000D62E3DB|nr:coiled-coil domain-containing protein 1-like [Cynara cardunculus var. scolymus]